jgi:tRNA dimethylallyltransferase
MKKRHQCIVVTGPTATGKTALAVNIARKFNGEIISADSRQVYRGMDLGTGKDLDDYREGGQPVKYHLIDVADPVNEYNLLDFRHDATIALQEIIDRQKLPIIAGGSPLYLDSILNNYELPGGPPDQDYRKYLQSQTVEKLTELLQSINNKAFEQLKDKNNRTRLIRAIEIARQPQNPERPQMPEMDFLILGVYFHRQEVHSRIEQRLNQRLSAGMIEEVEKLHQQGVSWERLEYFGLEYRFIAFYLQEKMTEAEMRERLFIAIRQFAKRQDIWFRKMEKEGKIIHWLDGDRETKGTELINMFLNGKKLPEPSIRLKDLHYGPKTS